MCDTQSNPVNLHRMLPGGCGNLDVGRVCGRRKKLLDRCPGCCGEITSGGLRRVWGEPAGHAWFQGRCASTIEESMDSLG